MPFNPDSLLEAALAYASLGWPVFPLHSPAAEGLCSCQKLDCSSAGKHPRVRRGVKDATTNAKQIAAWWRRWPEANIGIATGDPAGFWVLDVDGPKGEQSLAALVGEHGELPATLEVATGGGGRHILFRHPEGWNATISAGKLGTGLDTRATGGYIVAAPSRHAKTGALYEWASVPEREAIADAPAWLPELLTRQAPAMPQVRPTAPAAAAKSERARKYGLAMLANVEREMEEEREGHRNEKLFQVAAHAGNLSAACGISEGMAEGVLVGAALRAGLSESEARKTFASGWKKGTSKPEEPPIDDAPASKSNPGRHDARNQPRQQERPNGSLEQSQEHARAQAAIAGLDAPVPLEGYRLDDEDLTEMGQAIRFARLNQGRVLFAQAKGWLVWDGARFAQDDGLVQELVTAQILDLRREAAELRREAGRLRAQGDQVGGDYTPEGQRLLQQADERDSGAKQLSKAAQALGRSFKIRDIIAQVSSKPGVRTSAESFDSDPWLLNVRNGIVDLRTGELRPHDPAARITKMAGTTYAPEARALAWEQFIRDAFQNDPELIRFVQQLIGYTLTGDTREQKFYILEGTGGNGKGVFLDTVIALMGDYAKAVRKELVTLAANGDSQAGDDLVMLHTARLASVNELSEGDRLNVSRIKELTGGEMIAARPLYKQSFNFVPAFSLFIRTNHLPEAKVDDALADRLVRVPFRVKFRGTARDDKTLKARIMAELPGVLNWAIAGARDWLENGLMLPRAVAQANAEYVAEQDPIARFIAQLVERPEWPVGELYRTYEAWCKHEGVQLVSTTAFGKVLNAKGWRQEFDTDAKGKRFRKRIPPVRAAADKPVHLFKPVQDKIVSLSDFAQVEQVEQVFPLNQSHAGENQIHEGYLGGKPVPTRATCASGVDGAFAAEAIASDSYDDLAVVELADGTVTGPA